MEIKRTGNLPNLPPAGEAAETKTQEKTPGGVSDIPDSFETYHARFPVASESAVYSSSTSKLAQLTGKNPAEMIALLNNHGLDLGNLPNPPDSKIAALLNDPSFDSALNGLKAEVSSKYSDLKNEISKKAADANSINQSNLASDTSQVDNLDTTSFKYLYDAKNHDDDKSKALNQAREQCADRIAAVLSALYPTASVGPTRNSDSSEKIVFNGQTMNPFQLGNTGAIELGKDSAVDYPSVDLVSFQVDTEGDGATSIPKWMRDSGYPTKKRDD